MVGGQKTGGRKVRGQNTEWQKTGGQKSCHHFLVSRVVHRWRQKLHRADPADTPQYARLSNGVFMIEPPLADINGC